MEEENNTSNYLQPASNSSGSAGVSSHQFYYPNAENIYRPPAAAKARKWSCAKNESSAGSTASLSPGSSNNSDTPPSLQPQPSDFQFPASTTSFIDNFYHHAHYFPYHHHHHHHGGNTGAFTSQPIPDGVSNADLPLESAEFYQQSVPGVNPLFPSEGPGFLASPANFYNTLNSDADLLHQKSTLRIADGFQHEVEKVSLLEEAAKSKEADELSKAKLKRSSKLFACKEDPENKKDMDEVVDLKRPEAIK